MLDTVKPFRQKLMSRIHKIPSVEIPDNFSSRKSPPGKDLVEALSHAIKATVGVKHHLDTQNQCCPVHQHQRHGQPELSHHLHAHLQQDLLLYLWTQLTPVLLVKIEERALTHPHLLINLRERNAALIAIIGMTTIKQANHGNMGHRYIHITDMRYQPAVFIRQHCRNRK